MDELVLILARPQCYSTPWLKNMHTAPTLLLQTAYFCSKLGKIRVVGELRVIVSAAVIIRASSAVPALSRMEEAAADDQTEWLSTK